MAEAEPTYTEKKKALKSTNQSMIRPLARLESASRVSNGRKRKFTATKLRNGINSYFQWCETEDEIPSIKGMMIHLKTNPEMFYKFLKYDDLFPVLDHARLVISEWMENDVYNTKGMAVGKINYMKNVWDWKDRTENETTITKIDLTPEMARAKIEMLAPKLLEVLKNSEVLNQLTKRKDVTEADVVEMKRERRRIPKT